MTSSALTSREEQAIVLLARCRYLTTAQLQKLVFGDVDRPTQQSQTVMTRRLLNRLRSKGLVARTNRVVGGPTGGSTASAHYLTTAGRRLVLDLTAERRHPKAAPRGTYTLRHTLTAVDVILAFLDAARAHEDHALVEWTADWELTLEGDKAKLAPDGYIVYATGDEELHALIEVDLGTMSSPTFRKKILRYLNVYASGRWRSVLPIWPAVLVITTTPRRAELLLATTQRALATRPRLRGHVEFAFATLDEIQEQGPLTAIWRMAGAPGQQRLLDSQSTEQATPARRGSVK